MLVQKPGSPGSVSLDIPYPGRPAHLLIERTQHQVIHFLVFTDIFDNTFIQYTLPLLDHPNETYFEKS